MLKFCGQLFQLYGPQFGTPGWRDGGQTIATSTAKNSAGITVLRHPVDRVWSMYRFATKQCYKCHTLLDMYIAIDTAAAADTVQEDLHMYSNDEDCSKKLVCIKQLVNHQTRNLLTNSIG